MKMPEPTTLVFMSPTAASNSSRRPYRRSTENASTNLPRSGARHELLSLLRKIDGLSYGAYKRTIGRWNYGNFDVIIDRIQADPYAPPSSLRVVMDPIAMGLPRETYANTDQQLATGDFLIRSFRRAVADRQRHGAVSIAKVTQEILDRSAARVTTRQVELRIQVQMPARGRTIRGHQAASIFDGELPEAISNTLDFLSADKSDYRDALLTHVRTLEDHRALQQALIDNNWVAFVADHAVLARQSGISQLPMSGSLPFESPDSLRKIVTLPHAGNVTGMAIKPGITTIVGGGYHGKSTVLAAIERGVYPHVPGDGRELVAALPEAMKIRAADGRPVTKVDVSPFINHLPTRADTHVFSTENASGSTSQAASIVESLEMNSRLLLIDEDTSATNLMIRDERMRQLVSAAQEPITPLIDRIRGLADEGRGTSLILVMGGSGAFLDVADLVLQMDAYRCHDVTERAREVVANNPRELTDIPGFPSLTSRHPLPIRPGRGKPRTKAAGLDKITVDHENVDVSDVEQIVDTGQTEAIAWALRGVLQEWADGKKTLSQLMSELEISIDNDGFEVFTSFGARKYPAFMARPRMVDVAAAINRYRALAIR